MNKRQAKKARKKMIQKKMTNGNFSYIDDFHLFFTEQTKKALVKASTMKKCVRSIKPEKVSVPDNNEERKMPTISDLVTALKNKGEDTLADALNKAHEEHKTHITYRPVPDYPAQIIYEQLKELESFLDMSEEEQAEYLKKLLSEPIIIGASGTGKTAKFIRPNINKEEE